MNEAAASKADLLAAMAMQENGGKEARAAWGELFERHHDYIYVVVSRAYGSFPGEDETIALSGLRVFMPVPCQSPPGDIIVPLEPSARRTS